MKKIFIVVGIVIVLLAGLLTFLTKKGKSDKFRERYQYWLWEDCNLSR